MKIVADRQIPLVREAFASIGDVHLVDGRRLVADAVRDADVLLVRTITRVDEALLKGSRVRLVATASSGVDHVDLDYLERRDISLVAAAGCNARPVAEYVLSALFVAMDLRGCPLQPARIAIVGCGHVGSLLNAMLGVLGVECVLNDPPLGDQTGDPKYRPLEEALQADVITLHVPLTHAGPYATRQLINADLLARMKPEALLVNTSRGEVFDETALKQRLAQGRGGGAVLDVWANEPDIDPELLSRAIIATPHISGHSMNARRRATEMIYGACCEVLGAAPVWHQSPEPRELPRRTLRIQDPESDIDAVKMAVLAGYDVRRDSAALRRLPALRADERGRFFASLRDEYRPRPEFSDMLIEIDSSHASARQRLKELGFEVSSSVAPG